ncbi:MAG: D-glycero-beta-D-manno-heptose 1,7-bisphosphate 7-phosphatase [Candidatus Omnitrophica bacterium]|nr:D-glycero-beta-D-manno-heptose 1,7-bisphosphate 7-phosphatase [Candidatus Omnitrophota bacterium]
MRRARRGRARPAVFLDRDGTLARDVDYCRRPQAFRVFPGVARAIARLNQAGFVVIVVTNQSGVARGLLTIRALEAIHRKLRRDLQREGARIDAIYYCPHHPDDGCACRKPRAGLFRRAAGEFNLSMAGSYMVGDRDCDMAAGHAAGCRTILIQSSASRPLENGMRADHQAATLAHAVRWILRRSRRRPSVATRSGSGRATRPSTEISLREISQYGNTAASEYSLPGGHGHARGGMAEGSSSAARINKIPRLWPGYFMVIRRRVLHETSAGR